MGYWELNPLASYRASALPLFYCSSHSPVWFLSYKKLVLTHPQHQSALRRGEEVPMLALVTALTFPLLSSSHFAPFLS